MSGLFDGGGNQVNRQKASSHPLVGGKTYKGTVRSVVNGRAVVTVDDLGVTYNDVEFVGNTNNYSLSANDRVLCVFTEGRTRDIFIIGAYNKKTDTFVTKTKFNALIDELESRLGLASNALEAFKQTD
jgi:hypothetical protein